MISRITHDGLFIDDTTIAGESRGDGAYPHMADVLQLSHDRFLVVYCTRGFLGADDGFVGNDNDRSVLYQLRRNSPFGAVLAEGVFARYQTDWDVLGDGGAHLRQHFVTGSFGVPWGAMLGGKRVPHENVFAVSWYVCPRARDRAGALPAAALEERLHERGFGIEWVQLRLRADGGDIEILQEAAPLRERGYESGEAICSAGPCGPMNKWYVRPAAYTADSSQWAHIAYFAAGLAAMRFDYNHALGYYEWVQTGPLLPHTEAYRLMEPCLVQDGDRWVVAARSLARPGHPVAGIAWFTLEDLFGAWPQPLLPGVPLSKSPSSLFRCADGALRLITSDRTLSPHRNDRDPLYCWDVNAAGNMNLTGSRVVFDATGAGLPVRPESATRVDMGNLFPHQGGREQWVSYRVRLRNRSVPYTRLVDEERQRSGLYYGRLVYDDSYPATWQF